VDVKNPTGAKIALKFPVDAPRPGGVVAALEAVGMFKALEEAAVLELPEGLSWMHQPESRHLFLRPSAIQLVREVLRLYDQKKRGHGVVVTGTAGIGKSWFGELLLWIFVRLGFRVIFQQARENQCHFFDPKRRDSVSSAVYSALDWPSDFRQDKDAVLLFDPAASGAAVEPLQVRQFTVVTASPNRQHFKEFLKQVKNLRFLPVWSLDDLARILPFADSDCDEGALVERYTTIGGIPRLLFDMDKAG